ncbi:hypothetical protein BC629DRAFT_1576682 [Irpex lacteus]|nr:hypothetical protein BC629DRAFT_1576682 [Irpex lacteus]
MRKVFDVFDNRYFFCRHELGTTICGGIPQWGVSSFAGLKPSGTGPLMENHSSLSWMAGR